MAEQRKDIANVGLCGLCMGRGSAAGIDRRACTIDTPVSETLYGRLLARSHRVAMADPRRAEPSAP